MEKRHDVIGNRLHGWVAAILVVFAITSVSLAQAQPLVNDLKIESDIEAQMKAKIENTIATQLDPATFNVAVSVDLKKIPKARESSKTSRRKKNLDEPDLFIGLLDIDQIIDNYEDEIEDLRRQRDLAFVMQEPQTDYKLSAMRIRVGLHEKYGRKYFDKFDKWVSEYTAAQFGALAKVETEFIKIAVDTTLKNKDKKGDRKPSSEDKAREPKVPDTFENRTPYEKMRDFQYLIFGGLLFLVGIFLIITYKAIKSRDSFIPKTIRLDIPPLQVSNPLADSKEPDSDEEEEPVEDYSDIISNIERITHKIGILCFDVGVGLKLIQKAWLRQEDGDFKLALLLDAMITCRDKAAEYFPQDDKSWLDVIQIDQNSKEKMEAAFNEMVSFHPQEKFELLEGMYWELMTLKTLGPESYVKPFECLEEISEQHLEHVLNNQDRQSRNIALLYLEKVKKAKIIENMSYDQRRDLVKDVLILDKIHKKEFLDIETSIKVTAKTLKKEESQELVELFPKLSRVLSDLDPMEEIKILREIISELPNNGEQLKRTYPTWAYFNEWDMHVASRIVHKLKPQIVTQLVRCLPHMKNQFLDCCPEGLRNMVESDLAANYIPSIDEQRKLLTEARMILLRYLEKENLSLREIYSSALIGESFGSVA